MNQSFPVKDLLRKRFQTSLTVATLTLSVASTLFLLFFSGRIGVDISSSSGTLTLGLSAIFSQFIVFIGALIFVVGAILTSFIVFLMMTQRTRDFGLIKAAGCPNALVAGYFITELLIIVAVGTVLGIVFGFAADYVTCNIVFQAYSTPNWLFAPLVFVAFFILALAFGIKPIIKAAQMSPINALSPVSFYGMTAEKKHKPLSRSAITFRIATRSLSRRLSSSVRIVVLLSVVFILLTVSIAGGIIAKDTTSSWVEGTTGLNKTSHKPKPAHNRPDQRNKIHLSIKLQRKPTATPQQTPPHSTEKQAPKTCCKEKPLRRTPLRKSAKFAKTRQLPKKVLQSLEVTSKKSAWASNGDFRRYLYEAPIFSMPCL